MAKYRLLKDLPNLKKGTILSEGEPICGVKTLITKNNGDNGVGPTFIGNELFEEFFEEIQELTDNIHWKPKNGDEYFYISDYGDVYSDIWRGNPIDNERLALGIISRTEEECYKAYKRKLTEVRLRRTSTFKPDFINENGGYTVYYDPYREQLGCARRAYFDSGEPVRYETKEDAQKSIEENESDWKIYFGIKE